MNLAQIANAPATSDRRVRSFSAIPSPHDVLTEFPLGERRAERVARDRDEIADILAGRDQRLLVVVGPCSVHDPEAALEYASRGGRRLGGVAALSGGLITLDQAGDLDGTPVFMGVAPDDAHIPLSRFRESADHLRSRGAQVDDRVYPGLGHSINGDELDAVRRMMQEVAGQL